jgi:protein-tyrosine phosphatase
MTFSVLTVCSANTCRSPLMTVTLERALFAEKFGGDVTVRSGGVNAVAGQPVCTDVVRLTRLRGTVSMVLEQHRSAPLTDAMIEDADLILTADRRLRSAVVKRARGLSIERTFTLREALQLVGTASRAVAGRTTDERLRNLTAQMNHSRGFTDLPGVERVAALSRPWRRLAVHTHDVPDAHEAPRAPHPLVHRLIVPAAEQLVAQLAAAAYAATR